MTISRILVPTDFSPDADAAWEYAQELARVFHASLHLLHIVENPLVAGAWASDTHAAEIAGLQATLVRDAAERLDRYMKDAGTRRAGTREDSLNSLNSVNSVNSVDPVNSVEVRTGSPAAQILEAAAERDSDLIVMGTHGRTGMAHVVMGSVAERVVRLAHCPVLTLRIKTVDSGSKNARQGA